MDDYSDIINKKRPEHKNDIFGAMHPKICRDERAKMFLSFESLKDFSESVENYEELLSEFFD